jgi:replicative DNA helicase Mcm
MSEAFAKMELREEVTREDAKQAYELLRSATFAAAVDPVTGKIDMQALRTGVSIRDRETMEMGSTVLKQLLQDSPMPKDDALNRINEVLLQQKLKPLRWAHFKEVIGDLLRSESVIERGGQLSLP